MTPLTFEAELANHLAQYFDQQGQGTLYEPKTTLTLEVGHVSWVLFTQDTKEWAVSVISNGAYSTKVHYTLSELGENDLIWLAETFLPAISTPVFAEGIPIFNEDNPNLTEGLYLCLYHGYQTELDRRRVQDWGANGPMIGPLQYVHTTYKYDLKYEFVDPGRAALYGLDPSTPSDQKELYIDDDVLRYQGFGYGDWTVFYHKPGQP